MKTKSNSTHPPLVSIACLTYNHKNYIKDALEGFVKQHTSFRFEAIIHDDASTDGTTDIVKEYANRYPDIIKPILEAENLFSKNDGSLLRTLFNACQGKYIAFCEGDDYWTDSLKLQKQVDYLEHHPECTLCCTDCEVLTPNGFTERQFSSLEKDFSPMEVIIGGGWYISSPTIVFRRSLVEHDYPRCCSECHIADYPLQIYASLKGKVHYLTDKTSLYRYRAEGSWTQRLYQAPIECVAYGLDSEFRMLNGLDKLSGRKYSASFKCRIISQIVGLTNRFPDYTNEIYQHYKKSRFRIQEQEIITLLNYYKSYSSDTKNQVEYRYWSNELRQRVKEIYTYFLNHSYDGTMSKTLHKIDKYIKNNHTEIHEELSKMDIKLHGSYYTMADWRNGEYDRRENPVARLLTLLRIKINLGRFRRQNK